MDISWLGHSCVRIQSNDATLIADPYAESTGLSLAHQRADIVTISHEHPNHSHYAAIEGSPRVLRGPGEYEIGSFYITGMGTDRKGLEEENVANTVFVIHAEGLSLCHFGDLNHPLSPRQLEGLGQPDILFVPAGGVCTLGPSHVAQLANDVGPKIVVPVHYRTAGGTASLEPIDVFLNDMGVSEPLRHSRISVTALTRIHRRTPMDGVRAAEGGG